MRLFQVINVELPFDKEKKQHKGFCFITFDSGDVAEELLKTPKRTMLGKQVDIKLAKQKADNVPMIKVNHGRTGNASFDRDLNLNLFVFHFSFLDEYNEKGGHQDGFGFGQVDKASSCDLRIFVGGLPTVITAAEIKKFFERFGNVCFLVAQNQL